MPIPVTLLTGFLGSGKTTLLNALLRDPGMDRVAVVVNEFGEIGLDHDLIESSTETMVLMASGCLCCTVRGDLARTLDDLRERRESGAIAFDRVVIETTGLADPGPVVQTLVMDADLADEFVLDGVLTTADCATGPGTLDAQFEAVQQVAMADRIVLTKTDLVTPAARAAFEARLARPGWRRITGGSTRRCCSGWPRAPRPRGRRRWTGWRRRRPSRRRARCRLCPDWGRPPIRWPHHNRTGCLPARSARPAMMRASGRSRRRSIRPSRRWCSTCGWIR